MPSTAGTRRFIPRSRAQTSFPFSTFKRRYGVHARMPCSYLTSVCVFTATSAVQNIQSGACFMSPRHPASARDDIVRATTEPSVTRYENAAKGMTRARPRPRRRCSADDRSADKRGVMRCASDAKRVLTRAATPQQQRLFDMPNISSPDADVYARHHITRGARCDASMGRRRETPSPLRALRRGELPPLRLRERVLNSARRSMIERPP